MKMTVETPNKNYFAFLLFLIFSIDLSGQPANNTLLFGVGYYDEYMPYDRLEKDVVMMKEAGINVVRIAESTWGTVEPQELLSNSYIAANSVIVMEPRGVKIVEED